METVKDVNRDSVSSSSDLSRDDQSPNVSTTNVADLSRKRKYESRDSDNASPESSTHSDRNGGQTFSHALDDVSDLAPQQKRMTQFSSSSSAFDIFSRLPGMHLSTGSSGSNSAPSSLLGQSFSLFSSYPPFGASESSLPLRSSSAGLAAPKSAPIMPLLSWPTLQASAMTAEASWSGQIPGLSRRSSDLGPAARLHVKPDLNIPFSEYFENLKKSLQKDMRGKQNEQTPTAVNNKDEYVFKFSGDRGFADRDDSLQSPVNYVKGECDVDVTSQRYDTYGQRSRYLSTGSSVEEDEKRRNVTPTEHHFTNLPQADARLAKLELTPPSDDTATASTSSLSSPPMTSSSASYVRRLSDSFLPAHHSSMPDLQLPTTSTGFPVEKLYPNAAQFALATIPGVQIPPPAGNPLPGHPLLGGVGLGAGGAPGVGYAFHPALLHLGGLGATVRRPQMDKPPAVKKYKCDVCDKAFSRSNTLVTHKRIHTGDKPFKCERCGRAFRQPGNLTRHRLTHTTHKPYVCIQCGKAFNRASNLNTHMRTHSNLRPFPCVICGRAFSQKVDLRMHMYSHGADQHSPVRPPVRP